MGKAEQSALRAPKAVNDVLFYGLLVLNRTSPLIVFLLSQHGYLDWAYKYTLGVPTSDKRTVYSLLLMLIAVNLVAWSVISTLFQDPKEVPNKPKASTTSKPATEDRKEKKDQ